MGDLVQMGRGFDEFVDRMTQGGHEVSKAAVEDTLNKILEDALGGWRTRTGRSAAAFQISVDEDSGEISIELRNDSGYALAIDRGERWRTLLVLPFRTAVDLLPAKIERALSEIE